MIASRLLTTTILSTVVALAACGKKAPATGPSNNGGGAGGGAAGRLPWEAALTVGARFELTSEMSEDGNGPLVVTVTAVEDEGAARIYRLSWGEGEGSNGPDSIRVEGGKVRIGEASQEAMQEPWEDGGSSCYAEDYSNPDGCEDVCDANLCLDASGILSVGGLYAPNYSIYSRRAAGE